MTIDTPIQLLQPTQNGRSTSFLEHLRQELAVTGLKQQPQELNQAGWEVWEKSTPTAQFRIAFKPGAPGDIIEMFGGLEPRMQVGSSPTIQSNAPVPVETPLEPMIIGAAPPMLNATPAKLLQTSQNPDGSINYAFFCLGCNHMHVFTVGPGNGARWHYNENPLAPTFVPSLKIQSGPDTLCHLNVINGQIIYETDCKHILAGKMIPMQPLETMESV